MEATRHRVFDGAKMVRETVTTIDPVALTMTTEVNGRVGSARPLTDDEAAEVVAEVAARTADANGATIRAAAARALGTNRGFLSMRTPTQAQTIAQVEALTRQVQALIRLQLGELSETD